MVERWTHKRLSGRRNQKEIDKKNWLNRTDTKETVVENITYLVVIELKLLYRNILKLSDFIINLTPVQNWLIKIIFGIN